MRVALVLAGLAPVPQYEVRVGHAVIARVDLAFPEARVAIEYEGGYHFEGDQIVRDDARYARLRARVGSSSGSARRTSATWRPSSHM